MKSSRTERRTRAGQGIVALLITVLVLGAQTGAAAAPRQRHCGHPNGGDLNEFFETNHRIITDFCAEAVVGERWIPPALWSTNTAHEVIPEGYTPSRVTPMDDFIAKFVGARYVVDEGTKQERTY